jgi:hypothetical protein
MSTAIIVTTMTTRVTITVMAMTRMITSAIIVHERAVA